MKTANLYKNFFLLFLGILLINLDLQAQENIPKANFDVKKVVKEIYNADFSDDDQKIYEWIPAKNNLRKNWANPDDFVQTKIYKIFYSGKNKERITISTYTSVVNEKYNTHDCHACGRILGLISYQLNPKTNQYELLYANKTVGEFGNWGYGEKNINLIQITPQIDLIQLDSGFYTMGIATSESLFFYKGRKILELENSAFYEDAIGKDIGYEINFKTDQQNGILIAHKKGDSVTDLTNKKIQHINRIFKYQFNAKQGEFQKLK